LAEPRERDELDICVPHLSTGSVQAKASYTISYTLGIAQASRGAHPHRGWLEAMVAYQEALQPPATFDGRTGSELSGTSSRDLDDRDSTSAGAGILCGL
jgi:hypothetical protein